jgi:GR25 family glycosyltransferase involved in LPS biosynthesis/Flp pilus assembly protein TadD
MASATTVASAEALRDEARALAADRKHREALELLRRALAMKPEDLPGWLYRGISLQELHRPAAAMESYDRALVLRPDCVEALYLRALCLHELGRDHEALPELERVARLRPAWPLPLVKRGHVLRDLDRLEEAIASYDLALSLDPGNREAAAGRGVTVQRIGRRGLVLRAVSVSDDGPECYTGCYINLDRSTDRRAEVEREIARHAQPDCYRRFAAVDGQRYPGSAAGLAGGELGCFLSHCLLLLRKIGCEHHLHVVEDDVVFSPLTRPTINALVVSGAIDKFDIVFTDGFIQPTTTDFARYRTLFERSVERDAAGSVVAIEPGIIDYSANTTSYVVNRASISKVYSVLMQILDGKRGRPIDLAIRDAAMSGVLRVGCLFPFVTCSRIDGRGASTIFRSGSQLSRALLQMARYSFFVGADHHALLRQAADLLAVACPDLGRADPTGEPHQQLLDQVLEFCASRWFSPH